MPEEQVPSQDKSYVDINKVARQSEDFTDLYANTVLFEANAWDLRAIFGQFKAGATGEPEIEQHTAIAIPWSVAKIACMYLAINIIAYENDHGHDAIHLIPSMLGMLRLNEKAKSDPRVMTIFTALMSVGNPEIFSKPVVYEEPPGPDLEVPARRHIRFEEDEQPKPEATGDNPPQPAS